MDSRRDEMVEAVRATDFLLGRDEWGAAGSRRYREKQAAAAGAGERCVEDPAPEPPAQDRVRLRFLQTAEDHAVKEARVLAGTTVFDAASWNGVAIDSTCGGHGTCKKCKVRVVSGHVPLSLGRSARVLRRGAEGGLAARVPRAGAGGPDRRGAAAADAAEGGARRRRAARDPAARRAEAVHRAVGADARGPGVRSRARARGDGRPRAARSARSDPRARRDAARRGLEGDRRRLRRPADRRRGGGHVGGAVRDRVRPRHDHRRRDAARPRDRPARARCGRC